MLEQTFLHLPGVGESMEVKLWNLGFSSWQTLRHDLRDGKSIREILSDSRQMELFATSDFKSQDLRTIQWLDCLDKSLNCLENRQFEFFVDRLLPSDRWRILHREYGNTLYLDIETTGLSKNLHYITVIGAKFRGEFYQWVWPEPLDHLAELIETATTVVTFNGTRFDLPFLAVHAADLPKPKAHIDLLPVSRKAGFKGGQKDLEKSLGLTRESDLDGVDGEQAVALWCDSLYGNHESYHKLLSYNRADVEMMPQITQALCERLAMDLSPSVKSDPVISCVSKSKRLGHSPANFKSLRKSWDEKKPTLCSLEPHLKRRFPNMPTIVGIDLRSKRENPTGLAFCKADSVETEIVYDNETIIALTLEAKPDLVSIDAPLALPRGRRSVSDGSPCREAGGIVRDAERILWSRGIRVYPALIRQMQGLTERGIEITARLREKGIPVIESYPGAAQDVLGIPRKGLDQCLLQRGLQDFGFSLPEKISHDELDAVTSAMVGYFYLCDRYEGIGADDECFMIIPRWQTMYWTGRPTPSVIAIKGSSLDQRSHLASNIASRLGWYFVPPNEIKMPLEKIIVRCIETGSPGIISIDELTQTDVANQLSSQEWTDVIIDDDRSKTGVSRKGIRISNNLTPEEINLVVSSILCTTL